MGKFNFGIDSTSAANEELGDGGFYAGDTPPKGIYTCLVKQFKIKKNKNDDYRLSVLLEIQEPDDSDKVQYNGYGFWGGFNVTDEEIAKRFINNLLDGIGAKRTDFWAEKITTSPGKIDKDTAQDVLKIGARKTTGHMVRVATKFKPASGGYDEGLEPQRFLTDEDVPQRAEDEDAAGLGGNDADAGEEATTEESGEGYTQEELEELEKPDLTAICDEWGVAYAPKATKATLIKAILKFQEDSSGEEEAEDSTADEDNAASDEDTADAGDDLTEEDTEGMSKDELIEYMEEKGWEVPKPAIPSRLRKAILQFQAEPPF